VCKKYPQLFDAAMALMIIATILAGILAVAGIISMCRSKLPTAPLGGLGILTCLLILAAVIVIAVGIPSVFKEDNPDCSNSPDCSFLGSRTILGYTETWGPSTGWIFAVISAGCALAFAIIEFIM